MRAPAGVGRHRWEVERSLAWLLADRRLTVRWRRADILTALLRLACAAGFNHGEPALGLSVGHWVVLAA